MVCLSEDDPSDVEIIGMFESVFSLADSISGNVGIGVFFTYYQEVLKHISLGVAAVDKIFEKNEVEELIHAQCDCFYLYSGAVKSKLMRSLFKAMEK